MNYELFTRLFKGVSAPYTVREMGELTGISGPTVSRLNRGGKPDLDTFFAFCAWAAIAPSVFLLNQSEETRVCVSCRVLRAKLEEIQGIVDSALARAATGGEYEDRL